MNVFSMYCGLVLMSKRSCPTPLGPAHRVYGDPSCTARGHYKFFLTFRGRGFWCIYRARPSAQPHPDPGGNGAVPSVTREVEPVYPFAPGRGAQTYSPI